MEPPARLWPLVEWRAGLTPGGEMLVDERGRRMTFGAFRDRAIRVAGALALHGVRVDAPVAWQLPTTIEALLLAAGLARLGAVQVPIMASYGARELECILAQTGATYLLRADDVAESDVSPPAGDFDGDPVRWMFYTSGTTSAPKGARHTDGSVLASARALGDRMRCTADDRVGMAFPVAHIGGCGTWLGVSLRYGTTLILDAAFDPERTTALLQRERVTLAGSGTIFTQLSLGYQLAHPDTPLFPEVRAFSSGAAAKPAGLHHAVKQAFGVGVLSGYGLTEAPILAMSGPEDPDDDLAVAEGRVCDGVDLRVVDGELRVKAPQVMAGYVDAALDADVFDADGYLRTGDLGTVDAAGNLFITGRIKDVIIRKGETLSARAIEDELRTHPAVAEVAVIGVSHEAFGEIACAVVIAADGTSLTTADITEFLDGRGVPKRLWPERLEVVDDLPRSPTGKVRKSDLRDTYA